MVEFPFVCIYCLCLSILFYVGKLFGSEANINALKSNEHWSENAVLQPIDDLIMGTTTLKTKEFVSFPFFSFESPVFKEKKQFTREKDIFH